MRKRILRRASRPPPVETAGGGGGPPRGAADPVEILPGVIGGPVLDAPPLVDVFGGRGAHVEEEKYGHVALHLVPFPVELVAGADARPLFDHGLDDSVQLELLAVGEPLDPPE